MIDLAHKISGALLGWNWLEIIQATVSIFIASVVYRALGTWRQQSRAKLQIDFLDQLTDAVHAYIDQIQATVSVLRIIKLAIESYSGLPTLLENVPNPEAVAFIESKGKHESDRLLELLEKCKEPLVRIRSLVAKGQTLEFTGYGKCADACQMLAWQYDRIAAVAAMIGSQHLNWQNTEIQEALGKVLTVEPKDIDADLKLHNVNFLEFVQDSYGSVFRGA